MSQPAPAQVQLKVRPGGPAAALALVRDRYLYAALLVAILAIVAAYQFRLPFSLDVGGQIDRPLLVWVHDPQSDSATGVRFRWTTGGTEIVLPDWGRGTPSELHLRVTRWLPGNRINDLTLYVNDLEFASPAAIGQGWQEYTLPITEPEFLASDDLRIKIETGTFVPKQEVPGSADSRRLGVQLDSVSLIPLQHVNGRWQPSRGLTFTPFKAPPAGLSFYLIGSVLVLYLALAGFGLSRWFSLLLSAGFAAAVAVALVWARPYVTIFGGTFFLILLVGVAAAILARALVPRFFAWGGVAPSPADLDLLSLLFGFAFILKLALLLYPQTISFDLLYHIHRLQDVMRGTLFWSIPSGMNEFGGQPVPYLPSYYLFLAPFASLVPLRFLVQLSGVLLDSVTIFFLYYLARKYLGDGRAGLLAAWIYLLVPLAFIALSWGIYANLYGQFLTLVLAIVLVDQVDHLTQPRALIVVGLLFTLVFLSHTSVLVSIIPLFGIWAVILFLAGGWRARSFWMLVAAILVAAAISYGLYYSQFLGLVTQGTQQIAESAGDPATRSATGEVLTFWELLQPARTEFTAVHPYIYLSALAGLLLLLYRVQRAPTRAGFLLVAMLVAWTAAFALLVFVRAQFGFSSRYVNFFLPAIALCAGFAWAWLIAMGTRLGRDARRLATGRSVLSLVARASAYGFALVVAAQGFYHWFVLAMFKYH